MRCQFNIILTCILHRRQGLGIRKVGDTDGNNFNREAARPASMRQANLILRCPVFGAGNAERQVRTEFWIIGLGGDSWAVDSEEGEGPI